MTDTTAALRENAFRLLGHRPRLRATLISVACLLVGAVFFLASFGLELEDADTAGREIPDIFAVFLVFDLLVGVAASIGTTLGIRRARRRADDAESESDPTTDPGAGPVSDPGAVPGSDRRNDPETGVFTAPIPLPD